MTVYAKTHSLRCLKGFRTSDQIAPGNVLCHHSKHLLGYFKFQVDSNIICILWIFQKNWQPFPSKSLKRQRLITFIFIFNTIQYPRNLRNNIYHSKNETHHHFFIEIPILGHILVHSVDKTNILVVTVELIWLMFFNIFSFNFVPTPKKSLRFTRFKVTLLFCLVCVV